MRVDVVGNPRAAQRSPCPVRVIPPKSVHHHCIVLPSMLGKPRHKPRIAPVEPARRAGRMDAQRKFANEVLIGSVQTHNLNGVTNGSQLMAHLPYRFYGAALLGIYAGQDVQQLYGQSPELMAAHIPMRLPERRSQWLLEYLNTSPT